MLDLKLVQLQKKHVKAKKKKPTPPQLVKQFCSQGLFYTQETLLSELGANSDNTNPQLLTVSEILSSSIS